MSAITIRFPKSLHQQIRQMAEAEGISFNQFVVLALNEKIAVARYAQRLAFLPDEQLDLLNRRKQQAPSDTTMADFLAQHALDAPPDEEDQLGSSSS